LIFRNKDVRNLKIARLVFFVFVVILIFTGTFVWAQDAVESPLYGRFTEEGAAQFNKTAKTVLAPAYPYLAEFIVDRFGLRDKLGIGIDVGGGPGSLVLELSKQTADFFGSTRILIHTTPGISTRKHWKTI